MTLHSLQPQAIFDPAASPFLKILVRLIRAQDSYGAWERKSDVQILEPYVLTKDQRREIPLMGDPDPDILWRIEQFYAAIGLAIEQQTGTVASPMMKMHHEGFGRIILTCGKLVVLSKHLRDAHRFGFPSLESLAEAGNRLVEAGVATVRQFPDVAAA